MADRRTDIPAPAPANAPADPGLAQRITELEAHMQASRTRRLRRVLALMVDWVEQGDGQWPSSERLAAAWHRRLNAPWSPPLAGTMVSTR
jgi:hypothetical protein